MIVEKLREVILEQARFLQSRAGEFYPFGAFLTPDGRVVPLGVQLDNDHPQPQEVIKVLERVVVEKLKNNEATVAGIGTDVFYKDTEGNTRKSAIQIRLLQSNGESWDYYVPYVIEGGEFKYEVSFRENGTLSFLKLV